MNCMSLSLLEVDLGKNALEAGKQTNPTVNKTGEFMTNRNTIIHVGGLSFPLTTPKGTYSIYMLNFESLLMFEVSLFCFSSAPCWNYFIFAGNWLQNQYIFQQSLLIFRNFALLCCTAVLHVKQ